MNELIVVRHGESRYNVQLTMDLDSTLTEEGERQVRMAGKYLRETFPHIEHFVGRTSPYIRCLMTSRIIREETGMEFWVESGPREVMTPYVECSVPSRREMFPEFIWTSYPSTGITFKNETEEDFTERMKTYMHFLQIHNKVLVVSHGTPSTAIVQMAVGQYDRIPLHDFVDNASISYVREGKLAIYNHVAY